MALAAVPDCTIYPGSGNVAAHAVAALTTAMSDMLRSKRADLAAAQQIFIKAQLVAGDSGCQSCVMQ